MAPTGTTAEINEVGTTGGQPTIMLPVVIANGSEILVPLGTSPSTDPEIGPDRQTAMVDETTTRTGVGAPVHMEEAATKAMGSTFLGDTGAMYQTFNSFSLKRLRGALLVGLNALSKTAV